MERLIFFASKLTVYTNFSAFSVDFLVEFFDRRVARSNFVFSEIDLGFSLRQSVDSFPIVASSVLSGRAIFLT